jgi:hypothetical protein
VNELLEETYVDMLKKKEKIEGCVRHRSRSQYEMDFPRPFVECKGLRRHPHCLQATNQYHPNGQIPEMVPVL